MLLDAICCSMTRRAGTCATAADKSRTKCGRRVAGRRERGGRQRRLGLPASRHFCAAARALSGCCLPPSLPCPQQRLTFSWNICSSGASSAREEARAAGAPGSEQQRTPRGGEAARDHGGRTTLQAGRQAASKQAGEGHLECVASRDVKEHTGRHKAAAVPAPTRHQTSSKREGVCASPHS